MDAFRTRRTFSAALVAAMCLLALPLSAQQPSPVTLTSDVTGIVYESDDVDLAEAEAYFAAAEAAVYFPGLRRVRWLEAIDPSASVMAFSNSARIATVATFRRDLETDFPGFTLRSRGEYILKMPARVAPLESSQQAGNASAARPDATLLSEGFESGMSNWKTGSSTSDYGFTRMGCKVRAGSWSGDAVRGGAKGQYMFCSDTYPASVKTQIEHAACDGIAGASQAWLDYYLAGDTDASDGIGVYYDGGDGYLYGYFISGTWSGWIHIVMNLKQWNRIGDLTAQSCAKAVFQFNSDATATVGTGAFLDDVTIRTDAPPFIRCSITATPVSGAIPLTVSFTPSVSGASGSETYQWLFGDAAGSSSTSRTASFTYTTAGDYWARLRVAEPSSNDRGYAHVKISATSGTACSVSCSASVSSSATAGSAAAFQASATPSGCSGTTAYSWTFGDGQTSSQQNPAHTYTNAGTYAWTLTVTNGTAICSKSGSITVTAASTSTGAKRRHSVRAAPYVPAYEVTVAPSSSPQTFTYGSASVTLPGGFLSSAQKLSISPVTGAPAANYKGLQQMAVYDIRVGDLHQLTAPVTIRMKYDPSKIRTDMPAERAIQASYYDTDQSAWVTLPATIDTANREIVVTARHLSLFSWTMVKMGWSVFFKNHFYLVYDKAEVTDPNFLQWYRNPDTSNYVDINTPNFVEDVMAFLIDSYKVYVDDTKFSAPSTPVDVYVGTDLSNFADKITGLILISLASKNPEQLKMATAHELFHRVQNAYYYDFGGMFWLKWWLEASADYAAERVAFPGINQMGRGITQKYLEAPLTDSGEAHNEGYSTSHFIRYLVDNGANFKAMWDATANPDWFDSFSFLDGLSTYLMKVHGASNGLNRQYQAFARWFIFDPNSPMPAVTDSLHSEVAAYRSTVTDTGASATMSLKGGYTAKLWGIWFSETLFDTANPKRTYTVAVDGTLPSKVEADVYVLKKDQRIAGAATLVGTLSQTVKSVQVEVEKSDAVYVLAVNADNSAQEVKVKLGSEQYKCGVTWGVTTYKQGTQGGSYTICTGGCRPYDGLSADYGVFVGELSSNHFLATDMFCNPLPMYCKWRDNNVSYNVKMQFDVTNKGATVENLSAREQYGTNVQTFQFSGSIPKLSSGATGFQYKRTGADVCGLASYSVTGASIWDVVCDASSYILLKCDAYTPPK